MDNNTPNAECKTFLWGAIPGNYLCVTLQTICARSLVHVKKELYRLAKGRYNFVHFSSDKTAYMISQKKGKFWYVIEKVTNYDETLYSIQIYTRPQDAEKYLGNLEKITLKMKNILIIECRACDQPIIGEIFGNETFSLCYDCDYKNKCKMYGINGY